MLLCDALLLCCDRIQFTPGHNQSCQVFLACHIIIVLKEANDAYTNITGHKCHYTFMLVCDALLLC
jgi:hypothetical protein